MSFMIMTHAVKRVDEKQTDDPLEKGANDPAFHRPYTTIVLALQHMFPSFGPR